MDHILQVCRGCLTVRGPLYNLHVHKLTEQFEEFTGSAMSDLDGLPPFLCLTCIHLMSKYIEYREKFRANTWILKELVMNNELTKENIANIEITLPLQLSQKSTEVFDYIPSPAHIDVIKREKDISKETNKVVTVKRSYSDLEDDDDFMDEYDEMEDLASEREIFSDLYVTGQEYDAECYNHEELEVKYSDELNDDNISRDLSRNYVQDNIDDDMTLQQLKNDMQIIPAKMLKRQKKDGEGKANVAKKSTMGSIKYPLSLLSKKHHALRRYAERTRKGSGYLEECLTEFLKKYQVEVRFLTREEQLEEMAERKERFKHMSYMCEYCYRGFNNETDYNSHMKMLHDPSVGDYVCDICGVRARSPIFRDKHVNVTHRKRFTCKLCDKVTNTKYLARMHYAEHTDAKYTCEHCNKKFAAYDQFMNHTRLHVTKSVTCPICEWTIIGQPGIKSHLRTVHKDAVKCRGCELMFENAAALGKHLENATQDGVCQPGLSACLRCGKGFATVEHLTLHVRKFHTKIANCYMCNRTFRDEYCVALHVKNEHENPSSEQVEIKPREKCKQEKITDFDCETCGKSYKKKAHLQRHILVHTGEKPEQCPFCPKAFRLYNNLKMHIAVHTDERPYRCAECPAAFRQKTHLRSHMSCMHSEEKPFVCNLCNKRFSLIANMRQHVRSVHEGLPVRSKPRSHHSALARRYKVY